MQEQSKEIINTGPIALVDCNNFFVSCERVFDPSLRGVPTVVLSGTGGCAIARSNEAKKIGIVMGEPIFKRKELVAQYGIQMRTTNFALYSDLSKRVMTVLGDVCGAVEQYSIDEAFCLMDDGDDVQKGRDVKKRVEKYTGIPVSVGIAPTKTLAKIATEWAKRDASAAGVVDVCHMDVSAVDDILRHVDVRDVWGVGRGHAGFLRENNILTAYDLKKTRVQWLHKHRGRGIAETVQELNGEQVYTVGVRRKPPKGIMCTRSFAKVKHTQEELMEMIALYVTRATEKLRLHGLQAKRIGVSLRTNRFGQGPQYSKQMTVDLASPTAYTPLLIREAEKLLEQMFVSGLAYKKVGVYLSDFVDYRHEQLTLFAEENVYTEAQEKIMQSMDQINKRYGQDVIRSAAVGNSATWVVPDANRSQRFSTQWDEILTVKI